MASTRRHAARTTAGHVTAKRRTPHRKAGHGRGLSPPVLRGPCGSPPWARRARLRAHGGGDAGPAGAGLGRIRVVRRRHRSSTPEGLRRPGMDGALAILLRYGYLVVFGAVFAEQIGLPFPSEPFLLGAGGLIGSGRLEPGLVIVLASIAAAIADTARSWPGPPCSPRLP